MSHSECLLKLGEGVIENVVQNIITIAEYMVWQTRTALQQMVYQNFPNNCKDSEYLSARETMIPNIELCRKDTDFQDMNKYMYVHHVVGTLAKLLSK